MSLIILSAFEKLMSEPMEWPEEPPVIRFHVPPSRNKLNGMYLGANVFIDKSTIRTACFEHSGKYIVLGDKRTAALYVLVDF